MGIPQTGAIEFDLEARMKHVVGDSSRIAPLSNDEIDDETRALVNRVRAGAGAGAVSDVPEYMRLMLKHPELFRVQMEAGAMFYSGRLPRRERELAVLRCGWLCRAPYEWGEHVDISKRFGLTDAEVERVTRGSSAEGWSEHDRAILRGVEELIADQALSDETWDTLAKTWDEAQMMEFPAMVGQYVAIAFVQNSLRVRLASDNPGLSYR